jgi:polysaccharide chain length determinant protein (PEP-CTERM system associated)
MRASGVLHSNTALSHMHEILGQAVRVARQMWKFRWLALGVTWLCSVVGSTIVWRIPDQYEATARIFVDTDSILKPLMSGLAIQPNVDQQMAMLSRTLVSRPNLERLVRMADLDLASRSKTELDTVIERLQKSIVISSAGGVNLYSMSYRERDPEKAKRVVQSMVSIFVESGLGATRKDTDSAKNFINEQIKAVEGKLEEAESRMKEFRLRNIDRQGADGKDAASRIGEIATQLEAARLQLREAERRQLAEVRGQVQGKPLPDLLKGGNAGSTLAVATPEIDARLDAQRRNLDGLLQRYTDQHPDVLGARRLIADLEEQKRREVVELQRLAAAAAAAAPPPAAATESLAQQELNRVLAMAEVQVAAMQARVDEYVGRYATARAQLKSAPQIEAEAAQLNRDYTVTRKNYDELVARRQSAVMSGELDVAAGVTEFRLVDPPRVSNKPVSPNRMLLFPAVLLASMVAGALVAFGAVQLRPTFGDGTELRQLTGLPLLGVVTRLVSPSDRQRRRSSLLRFFGAFGSLLALSVAGMLLLVMTNR